MEKYAYAQIVFEYLFGEMWKKVIGRKLIKMGKVWPMHPYLVHR